MCSSAIFGEGDAADVEVLEIPICAELRPSALQDQRAHVPARILPRNPKGALPIAYAKEDAPVPSWRPLTWFIIMVQVLFVTWLVFKVIAGFDACPNDQRSDVCRAGGTIGTGIGMGIFVFLCVDVLLSILWMVTDQSRRTCPGCGQSVKNDLLACPGCGLDFAAAPQEQEPPAPPPVSPG
jgi:hypothetical protein